MKIVELLVQVLVVVGAINWGLVGAFNFNLVSALLGFMPGLEKLVYILVGVAGLYAAYLLAVGYKKILS